MSELALELRELDVVYTVRGIDRRVLRGVTFEIGRGESYGLVGESGCGKSTAALAIVRYLARNGRVSGGSISVAGRDVLALGGGNLRRYRAEAVSMVYQNPGSALNPSIRVGAQVAEAFTVLGASQSDARERARAALARVQIADPDSVMARYPHQLSGGMQQRGSYRDGTREGSCASDSRRADDRPGRDRRGGGSRSRLAAAGRASYLRALHQPQPRRDLEDVLAGRRALRGQARRGRTGRHRTARPAPSVHGRDSCAASRAEALARTTAASTRSRASCRASGRTSQAVSSPTAARSPTSAAAPRSRRSSPSRTGTQSRCWYHERLLSSRARKPPTWNCPASSAAEHHSSSSSSSRKSSSSAGATSMP